MSIDKTIRSLAGRSKVGAGAVESVHLLELVF